MVGKLSIIQLQLFPIHHFKDQTAYCYGPIIFRSTDFPSLFLIIGAQIFRACYPCKSSNGKGISCGKDSVVYEIRCIICEHQGTTTLYIGETIRSILERVGGHMQMFKVRRRAIVRTMKPTQSFGDIQRITMRAQ